MQFCGKFWNNENLQQKFLSNLNSCMVQSNKGGSEQCHMYTMKKILHHYFNRVTTITPGPTPLETARKNSGVCKI
jgi:hypothetical protein